MRYILIPAVMALFIIFAVDGWLYCRLRRLLVRRWSKWLFWLPALFFVLFLLATIFLSADIPDYRPQARAVWVRWLLMFIYLPKLFYVLYDAVRYAVRRLMHRPVGIFSRGGAVLAALCALLLLYGATAGRTGVYVKQVEVVSPRVPEAMDGFRIVQFSDAHIGNWNGSTRTLEKAVRLIDECHPDMVVFTGDFVCCFASEITPEVKQLFRRLDAPYGLYAVLGNHDYGDYYRGWGPGEQAVNIRQLLSGLRDCGFEVLLNESRTISVADTSWQLVGVENAGRPPFRQYDDLPRAIEGLDTSRFTLLLSHEPLHWRREVLDYPFIDLMLAGHTHAGQSGIVVGSWRWSPSTMMFEEWDGLYREGLQMLYVNRGLGYVGVPLRVGMPPEITCITLRRQ